MDKIFNLLGQYRLDAFYNKFLEIGVKDERDFIDGITEDDLNSLGLSHVEQNRFQKMKDFIHRIGRAPAHAEIQSTCVMKSTEAFHLFYSYPKCPEPKEIQGIDPYQNTLEDVMLRIGYQEDIGKKMAVCLYTAEGMPLSDDPFFNTWSLNERHIENGSHLYVIFTPKENLKEAPQLLLTEGSRVTLENMNGEHMVRCHIMLKGDYTIAVDLEQDTLPELRKRLSFQSGIPSHVLHCRNVGISVSENLKDLGINEESVVYFSLSSFDQEFPGFNVFTISDVLLSVPQTKKGMSTFFSTLHAIRIKQSGEGFKKVVAYIRKLTGFHPLAQVLHQLMCRNEIGTRVQKIALVEGLYTLFRELLPSLTKRTSEKIIEDQDVFEYSSICWAYLMSEAEGESSEHENFASMSLICQQARERFTEPVYVPGIPQEFERAYVLKKIKDGEKIPNCAEERLKETSLRRATKIEKILLSVPLWMQSFPLWISYGLVSHYKNFQVQQNKTFGEMYDCVKSYPHLALTPPLELKAAGVEGPRLVLLGEENVGVYMSKDKLAPQKVFIFDSLSGKLQTVDVETLARSLRDVRSDQMLRTTRIPKEAILVLLDSSSSMGHECYDSDIKMKRIDAVKQLFDAFANRSMAYDFHHVIGLVQFGSKVTTLHTFTEIFETFKEHIHSLEAAGKTRLYDALYHGVSELTKIKAQFPDCRLRILCLTDGNDVGSLVKPAVAAKILMISKIVVDSVLLGKVENTVLHGISNATGGCCFKPESSKAALKLFEMEPVLSMEMRKPKKEFVLSDINTESDLKGIFSSHGYDEHPEVKLPVKVSSKVTVTENALKKKIKESKSSRFMEKDKRILEELKNLHCDPHPYCSVLPNETDLAFWKILMQGPPDTPYENGVFELYCEFGPDYPVKPPLVRFLTSIYHCNVNSVGRICHNIFDRNYSAHITMREILDAIYGLLIAPEPQDPLDSVLAEEYMTSREKYEQEAKKTTETTANITIDAMEEKLIGPEKHASFVPAHLKCPLTGRLFIDPVKTRYGTVYERKAIERYLQKSRKDPQNGNLLRRTDMKQDKDMKRLVKDFRNEQIKETAV